MEPIKVFTRFKSNTHFIPLSSVAEIRTADNSLSVTNGVVEHNIEVRLINETEFIPVDGKMSELTGIFFNLADYRRES